MQSLQCYFQKLHLQLVLLFLFILFEVLETITVLDKGITPLEKDTIGIQFFIDVENKDRISHCRVATSAKECCLKDVEEDCNTMQVFGGIYHLKPKDRDTFIFVYPTLYPHDQVGFCEFILEYRCGETRRSKKQCVKIPFDTKIVGDRKKTKFFSHYIDGKKKKFCDTIDQDSLNDCEPVDCDFKYCGNRQFFDHELGKCLEAPLCESDPNDELPDVVYVPSTNKCKDLEHPLTVSDIYALSTGTGILIKPSDKNDVKLELRSNCSTISQNLNFLRDLMCGNFCPMPRTDTSDLARCWKSAILAIVSYVIVVCALVLSFICCVQSLIWLQKKVRKDEFCKFCESLKGKFTKSRCQSKNYDVVNSEIRNNLLRDVIVKDIPIELRESVVDICDRMDRQLKKKKRYRRADMGSQISLSKVEYDIMTSTATSSTTSIDVYDR